MASSAPNGSSIRRRPASWASARARAARWRIPPESSWGRLAPKPPRWTRSSRSAATDRRSTLRDASQPQRELDVCGHRQPGEQRRVLEEHGGGRAPGRALGARAR